MFGGGKDKGGAAAGGADDKNRKQGNPNPAPNTAKTNPVKPVDSKPAASAPATASKVQNHKRENTPDGGYIEDRGNHKVKFNANGTKEWMKNDKGVVQYRKDGTPSQKTRGDTVTTYHADGGHTVQKNGVTQYTQRPKVDANGKKTFERVYTDHNNRQTVKQYEPVQRGRTTYNTYISNTRYEPAFYGYVMHPWRPYSYSWGWYGHPWYSPYSYYFAPYPVYYGPSYWLTDWILADMLLSHSRSVNPNYVQNGQAVASAERAADRAERAADNAERLAEKAQITKEIKDQIQEQVKTAVQAQEKSEPLSLQRALDTDGYIFAVTEDVDALLYGGEQQSCSLSAGDLIKTTGKVSEDETFARMIVVTAKKGGCKPGTQILVSAQDLQEMQNAFAERIEKGMKELKDQKESGKIDAK